MCILRFVDFCVCGGIPQGASGHRRLVLWVIVPIAVVLYDMPALDAPEPGPFADALVLSFVIAIFFPMGSQHLAGWSLEREFPAQKRPFDHCYAAQA